MRRNPTVSRAAPGYAWVAVDVVRDGGSQYHITDLDFGFSRLVSFRPSEETLFADGESVWLFGQNSFLIEISGDGASGLQAAFKS